MQWVADSDFRHSGYKAKQFYKDNYKKPYGENQATFYARQYWLCDIIEGYEFNRLIERLKWHRPEIGKDLDKQRERIVSEFQTVVDACNSHKSYVTKNDELLSSARLIDGYVEELSNMAPSTRATLSLISIIYCVPSCELLLLRVTILGEAPRPHGRGSLPPLRQCFAPVRYFSHYLYSSPPLTGGACGVRMPVMDNRFKYQELSFEFPKRRSFSH